MERDLEQAQLNADEANSLTNEASKALSQADVDTAEAKTIEAMNKLAHILMHCRNYRVG